MPSLGAIAEVAARFCVGVASVVCWLKDPEPKRTRNKPATKINMTALVQDVMDYPDAYQCEHAQRLFLNSSIFHLFQLQPTMLSRLKTSLNNTQTLCCLMEPFRVNRIKFAIS